MNESTKNLIIQWEFSSWISLSMLQKTQVKMQKENIQFSWWTGWAAHASHKGQRWPGVWNPSGSSRASVRCMFCSCVLLIVSHCLCSWTGKKENNLILCFQILKDMCMSVCVSTNWNKRGKVYNLFPRFYLLSHLFFS